MDKAQFSDLSVVFVHDLVPDYQCGKAEKAGGTPRLFLESVRSAGMRGQSRECLRSLLGRNRAHLICRDRRRDRNAEILNQHN